MSLKASLPGGVQTVIKRGDIKRADHARWANTYNATPQEVEDAISIALTLRARENEGEGK